MTQAPNDAPRGSNRSVAVEFLAALFNGTSDDSNSQVYLSSLPNERDDPLEPLGEKHVCPPSGEAVNKFIQRYDRPRRGLFVCVGTVADNRRNKDNVRETVCLHCDVDFKNLDCDEPTIRAALDRLPTPPSIVVRSGNGLHLYWLLREPIDTQRLLERIEAALRKLADVVGGDGAVCHVAALMRLPGTHNTKKGDFREVKIERLDSDVRYELEDLEDWLDEQRPVLTRKPVEPAQIAGPIDDNPYLKHAKEWGYKPRLDVERRLAELVEGNIHITLRDVAASLIHAGQPMEEVVGILMEAARKVGGPDWNWRAEEKKIRDLCSSAERKFPPKEPAVSRETDDELPGTVVDLGKARAKRKPKVKAAALHIVLAEAVLAALRQRGENLMFMEQGSYRYGEGLWRLLDDKSLRAWLDKSLEEGAQGLKLESTNKLISEARGYILRLPELHRNDIQFDAHGCVPTRSGLVNPRTGLVSTGQPEHYCTWRIPIDYDPEALCPYWLQILEETFSDRDPRVRSEYISVLQEWAGTGLIDRKPKALSRAFSPTGASNTGKSTLIDVLAGLFSASQITTPIDALDSEHGTVPFAYRVPWVLHEAFDGSRWHISSKVKAIIEGKPIQINVKNGKIFDHAYTAPVLWGANAPPQFKEATKAITNRLLLVECKREFDEDEQVGAAIAAAAQGFEKPSDLVLRSEMPGVLAWAMEGLARALARGFFLIPAEARAALESIQRDSNIVQGFVEDCTDFNPDGMVSAPDFSAAFSSWWVEHKGGDGRIPSGDSVGRALKALGSSRIAIDLSLRDKYRRYYAGVWLNAEGKRHWDNSVASDAFVFQGRKASTTASGGNPNTAIPQAWNGKIVIEAMRVAQAKRLDTASVIKTRSVIPDDTNDTSMTLGKSEVSYDETPEPPEEIPF
jgi:hypothetical protein